MKEYFEKVYIKTVDDLPKEEDEYFVMTKENGFNIFNWYGANFSANWMKEVKWYLRPLKMEGFYEKEFIMWLSFGSHPFVPFCDMMDGKLEQWYTDEISIHYSLDKLYLYWQTNVKDK
jgi:hypothetical protein